MKNKDDIVLGVTKIIQDELKEKYKEKIIQKSNNICSCCGASIKESYFIDKINEDNNLGSYRALCDLCFYANHLEMLTFEDPGKIILLPEISQLDLLNIVRGIEHIKSLRTDYEEEADSVEIIEVLIQERADLAETFYAPGISNVDLFTQVLYSFSEEKYSRRSEGFYNLRWLPNMNNFEKHQNEWNETNKNFTPNFWKPLIKKMASKK